MNPMKQRDVIVDWFDAVQIKLHTPYDVADHMINYLDTHGWKIVLKEIDSEEYNDPEEYEEWNTNSGTA